MLNTSTLPFVDCGGGDFNIIRKISESNRRKNFLNGLIFYFIQNNELKELELDGRCFTWSIIKRILLWKN